ncbi:hypothetical protein L9F63_014018, partial [Diploptera punctata]
GQNVCGWLVQLVFFLRIFCFPSLSVKLALFCNCVFTCLVLYNLRMKAGWTRHGVVRGSLDLFKYFRFSYVNTIRITISLLRRYAVENLFSYLNFRICVFTMLEISNIYYDMGKPMVGDAYCMSLTMFRELYPLFFLLFFLFS